jgi:7-cyano-7-deazaguanine synthase
MSGGMDSTALCHLLAQSYAVSPIFIDYGQPAVTAERLAAHRVAAAFQLPLRELRFTGDIAFGSGEIRGRNLFLLSAALMSLPEDHNLIALGIHAGTSYYDCSEAFIERIDQLIAEYTDRKVSVLAPFLNWLKPDIYSYSKTNSLPISLTYSCESGEEGGCGECNSCLDRRALGC